VPQVPLVQPDILVLQVQLAPQALQVPRVRPLRLQDPLVTQEPQVLLASQLGSLAAWPQQLIFLAIQAVHMADQSVTVISHRILAISGCGLAQSGKMLVKSLVQQAQPAPLVTQVPLALPALLLVRLEPLALRVLAA